MYLVDIIAGARPNFMKIAPIIHAIKNSKSERSMLSYRLIHTGQHYDKKMSRDFFDQLSIPRPDLNLEVGSGSQAEQSGAMMIGYEKAIINKRPDMCLVVGDVTSTMACAITAQKLKVPVAHVEAGIRSGDWEMPEEINRRVTDAITNWFFTTSEVANKNLINAGVNEDRIFFVGNTMIDTLLANLDRIVPPVFWGDLKLKSLNYFVATLHRPSNVDKVDQLELLLKTIAKAADKALVVFPVHPRVKKSIELIEIPRNICLVDPQPYLQFIYLVKNAKGVITDSGGITEETTVMGVPCLTLRHTTERPETVIIGTNELIGTNPKAISAAMEKVIAGEWKRGGIPPMWDGQTAKRIVNQLRAILIN